MQTTTITVPSDKAEHLNHLGKLSAGALKILADKVKTADAARIADLEKKIDSFKTFM